MKKIHKILSIILTVLIVFSFVPIADVDAYANSQTNTNYELGDIIEFGLYPQSKVTDSVLINNLNSLSKTWISYEYYNKGVASDYMQYADVIYNGNKYRAVYFTQYREHYTNGSSFELQCNNGYYTNTVYWFKYEPIQWRILDPNEGFVMCEKSIDAQPYNNVAGYNDYATSYIRNWLADDFYNIAFTDEEKAYIKDSILNNDCWNATSSQGQREETNDKVFLLSYEEITNNKYGFSSNANAKDTTRQGGGTDYAECQALHYWVDYPGLTWVYLRSPIYNTDRVCSTDSQGNVRCVVGMDGYSGNGNCTGAGVRPAMRISFDRLEHQYESVVTAPTCAERGYTTYTCTECGYSYVGNYVDALGHDVVWKTIAEPTCTTDGAKVKGCSRCDAEEITVLLDSSTYPQSPHNYSNNYTKTYNFSYEGAEKLILTFSPNTAFESNYDYLYIYDSNGTQIGKYSGTSLASKVITINGDSFSLKLTTDVSNVYYGFSFSKIEAYMNVADTEEIIPATGHTEEVLPAVEPTCTETGLTEGKKCTVCGEVLVEQTVIDALGHTEEILPAVEATCTEAGLTEGKKCTVCGETLVEQTVVEALGHTEETIVGVVPTCIDSGISDGIKCTVCGEILLEQKTLPPTGHTRVTVPGKAPTCTEDGYTDSVKCSVCNEILVEASVLKATHTRVAITAKAPTCVEEGHTEGVKCAVCDEILVAPTVIEKTAHADDNNDGYCDNCSFIVNQDLIEKNCNCDCHGNNFMFRFILFFQRLFGLNKYCACGVAHY